MSINTNNYNDTLTPTTGALVVSSTQTYAPHLQVYSTGSEAGLALNCASSSGRLYELVSGGVGGTFAGGVFGLYDATATAARFVVSSTGNFGIGTVTPNSLFVVNGPFATKAPSTVTAATYSQTTTDGSIIFNTTATHTLTLLAASTYVGQWLYVKTIAAFAINSASSNVVPIGSATAGTAILAATAGKWAALQSDGTNWVVMMAN